MKEKSYPSAWALLLFVIAILLLHHRLFPEGLWPNLVDAHVYAASILVWLGGGNPYQFTTQMNLLYPPVFLYAGGTLARVLTPHVGWIIFLVLHTVAAIALPWTLYRFYLRETNCTLPGFYVLFFAAPGLMGLVAFQTGNIAVICYATMLLAGASGLVRNRWLPFYLAVFLCCSIKITFLPMLLLPVFCGRKQWAGIITCAAASIAGLESNRWIAPALYARFLSNLKREAAEMGDVGKGVFGILFHSLHKAHHESLTIPTLGYAILALMVIAALTLLWRRGFGERFASWPGLVLIGILFTTPRVNYYDLCIGFPLAFAIAMDIRGIKHTYTIYALYMILSVSGIFFLARSRDTILNGGFEALIILAFFFYSCTALARQNSVERAMNLAPVEIERAGIERA